MVLIEGMRDGGEELKLLPPLYVYNQDGTYSDARVLTPYELMILTSLPSGWNIPDDTPEILIRQVIGESIPPLMVEKIVGEISCLKK